MEANINILLTENEQMVGYLLAMPHNDAVQELKEDDPDLKEDPMKYYIETVAVLPEFRRRKGLATMLYKLAEECHKRGTDKVSIHARVSNRLSEIIQNNYRVIEVRRIERWKYYNCEEPADYIEIILTTVGLEAPS
jgi:ribosomal protein S18 acetylase RimI-like enzyme